MSQSHTAGGRANKTLKNCVTFVIIAKKNLGFPGKICLKAVLKEWVILL